MAQRLHYPRVLFRERQRVNQPLYRILLLPVAAALLVFAHFTIREIPRTSGGDRVGAVIATGLMLAVGTGLVLLVLLANLTVIVTSQELVVTYFMVLARIRKRIPIDDIEIAQAETYEPMREFLGWGIKYSLWDSTTSYTVSGNRGVRVKRRGGEKLLVGSNRADELAAAIAAARTRLTP